MEGRAARGVRQERVSVEPHHVPRVRHRDEEGRRVALEVSGKLAHTLAEEASVVVAALAREGHLPRHGALPLAPRPEQRRVFQRKEELPEDSVPPVCRPAPPVLHRGAAVDGHRGDVLLPLLGEADRRVPEVRLCRLEEAGLDCDEAPDRRVWRVPRDQVHQGKRRCDERLELLEHHEPRAHGGHGASAPDRLAWSFAESPVAADFPHHPVRAPGSGGSVRILRARLLAVRVRRRARLGEHRGRRWLLA
mmetsp:Transcript_17718/g.42777  ORF Transcript_17718/g.42777 Transcript_17718/m.42777 type:complete len:249 (+) Transcript_17718:1215-1961(+)